MKSEQHLESNTKGADFQLEPVKINLATFRYYDKRVAYLALVAIALTLAGITLFNLNRSVHYQKEILSYKDKIRRLEKRLSKRKQTRAEILKQLKGGEIRIIHEGAKLVNQIIVKDIFPWDRLLDAIETGLPGGVILRDIKPSDAFNGLMLSGFAERPDNITHLLKALKESGLFEKSLLTRLSVGEEKVGGHPNQKPAGIFFEVENTIMLERLFHGKKFEPYLEDIREAFPIG